MVLGTSPKGLHRRGAHERDRHSRAHGNRPGDGDAGTPARPRRGGVVRHRAVHLAAALRGGGDASGRPLARGGTVAAAGTHGVDERWLSAADALDVETERRDLTSRLL